jgi:hypothetical protein
MVASVIGVESISQVAVDEVLEASYRIVLDDQSHHAVGMRQQGETARHRRWKIPRSMIRFGATPT